MNKIIPTEDRVFMSIVGPSGCGKTRLIYDMLRVGTFQPSFDKILFFYQHYQPLYDEMQQNIEFVQCLDFDLINNLPNDGTNYLLIFDDSCADLSRDRNFEKLATSGRHRKLNVIYIKHNLYHKSAVGRDPDLQNTHIVLFKSPRDVQQITRLGTQLGLGKQLTEWYKRATSDLHGHLMIDLHPKTRDELRYCSRVAAFPTKFYLPLSQAKITNIDDEHTKRVYSFGLPNLFTRL